MGFWRRQQSPASGASTPRAIRAGSPLPSSPHRGPRGEPPAQHPVFHRGTAVLHRRGRPARLRHDPEQPGPRLRRPSHRGPGRQPGPGDRLLHRGAAVPHAPRPPRSTTPRPRTTWASPTPRFRPGTGRPTWPARSAATPRRCGSAPRRPPRRDYAATQHNLGARLRRPSGRGPGGQPGPGDRLLRRGAAVLSPPRPPRLTTPRPRTTWARLRRPSRLGTGRPTWPGRSAATPRRCGSAPPRPPRTTTP